MSNKELEEHTIRTAANLAAIYSKSKYSSSVPVDYTKVKNVKKVPGETGSYVTYTNQKTIYIDPDLDLIKKIRKG
jgi:predicted ribosome quality control (RQC) complex YloA/Tae2 family protein